MQTPLHPAYEHTSEISLEERDSGLGERISWVGEIGQGSKGSLHNIQEELSSYHMSGIVLNILGTWTYFSFLTTLEGEY